MLRTSAKVNLALEVLGKRDDGYHEIATVMQAVDLCDRLTVETADTVSLVVSDPALPTDDGNLIVRAAAMLGEAAGATKGARITLDKHIPVAAGLGGGSSDAAATLWALNRLWGLRWSRDRLAGLAVRLGMDVPFFLGTGRVLATGRGEQLKPLPDMTAPRAPAASSALFMWRIAGTIGSAIDSRLFANAPATVRALRVRSASTIRRVLRASAVHPAGTRP